MLTYGGGAAGGSPASSDYSAQCILSTVHTVDVIRMAAYMLAVVLLPAVVEAMMDCLRDPG